MIAALDVHYTASHAHAATVLFAGWQSDTVSAQYGATLACVADYTPGAFYQRELAPLLAVIARIVEPVDAWIVDGYCQLSPEGAPGLGAHLQAALARPAVVIGVAKRRFRAATHAVEITRGDSRQPLFVTAIGMEADVAARHVASMAGMHRLPNLLKAVDRLARSGVLAPDQG